MSNLQSIYARIKNIIEDKGELPRDFVPEEKKKKSNRLSFAPGAIEGILSHHTSGQGGKSEFPATLVTYLNMSQDEALSSFETNVADDFVASEGQAVLKAVMSNQSAYPPGKIYALAYNFAANGRKVESVKLGLTLLRLFDVTRNENHKGQFLDLFKNLGCCEDFTGYVLDNLYYFTEGERQELLLFFADKLHGWGKINVVESLKPSTPEIKNWILCHGCKNDIMYNYLALVCATKCELKQRLWQGGLSDEEFAGATDIMMGLIDEGPCPGLSATDEPQEIALAYLRELRNRELNITLVDFIYGIEGYFINKSLPGADEVSGEIAKLTESIDMESFIKANMSSHTFMCLRLSDRFNIDLSEDLLVLIENDIKKYFNMSGYILKKSTKLTEFFALCDERIKEEDYPNEMGDSMQIGPMEGNMLPLDLVVQYLEKFPLKGRNMIKICMQSPVIRWRGMAARTLAGWVDELGKRLPDIDEELADMVAKLHYAECNDQVKDMWKKLL